MCELVEPQKWCSPSQVDPLSLQGKKRKTSNNPLQHYDEETGEVQEERQNEEK